MKITRTKAGTYSITGLTPEELGRLHDGLSSMALAYDAAIAPTPDPGRRTELSLRQTAEDARTMRRDPAWPMNQRP